MSPGGRGPAGGTGRCLIPACRAAIPVHRLMCAPHWQAVPRPLRDAVWAAWRSGAGVTTKTYWDALGAAVSAAQAQAQEATP